MLALACAFMLLGLVALALAMDRHAAHLPQALAGHRARRALRILGCMGLAASLACTWAGMDGAMAAITWLGLLAPGTLCIAVAMAWAGRSRGGKGPRG
ncbi:DUF3325 family protein [Acidovorax sp.]|jgi:hypothetical protein|uniref:DUF3325 family protein n=1 Tax=Acidovorax sp. TaxID=1872122 RepID=UPI002ACE6CFA|nr:DUF3325 family protein [Acidovorax sp.]MDZ7863440.1 DUF3325 family protein [Acidovorax sp.]